MRIKGIISYNGKSFYGYQIQKNPLQRSVQKDIQDVLSRICNEEIKIYSSGRTDRGVHALNQVIHFDLPKEIDLGRLKHSLNSLLEDDIYVKELEEVDEDFHARFSAKSKEYHYLINVGEFDPIKNDLVYNLNLLLDEEMIKKGMKEFIGEHSFINFCANNDGDYIRTIYSFELERKDNILEFRIKGNGFRRYMVRMIIGTLVELGLHKIDVEDIKKLLNSQNMQRVSYKAPSNGLYLYKVTY